MGCGWLYYEKEHLFVLCFEHSFQKEACTVTDNEKELLRLIRQQADSTRAIETALAVLLAFWEQEKGGHSV